MVTIGGSAIRPSLRTQTPISALAPSRGREGARAEAVYQTRNGLEHRLERERKWQILVSICQTDVT